MGTNIINKITKTKEATIDYLYQSSTKISNFTESVNQYANIAGKAAKILTNTLGLTTILTNIKSTNSFIPTKTNAIGITVNIAGLIANTDALLTGGKALADSGVKSLANYGHKFLPEQFVDSTEDLLRCLGHSAKEGLNELPLNITRLINNINIFKIATTTFIKNFSLLEMGTPSLINSADVIDSANFARIMSTIVQQGAIDLIKEANTKLSIDLSYLTQAKDTANNYLLELLTKETLVTTEKIINHVYEAFHTDYPSMLINTAGVISNGNWLYNISNGLAKNISPIDLAKLVNAFSYVTDNTHGLVNYIATAIRKINEENKDDINYKDEDFIQLVEKEVKIENKEDDAIDIYDLQSFYVNYDKDVMYYTYINDAGDPTCKVLSEIIGKHSISYFDIYE